MLSDSGSRSFLPQGFSLIQSSGCTVTRVFMIAYYLAIALAVGQTSYSRTVLPVSVAG